MVNRMTIELRSHRTLDIQSGETHSGLPSSRGKYSDYSSASEPTPTAAFSTLIHLTDHSQIVSGYTDSYELATRRTSKGVGDLEDIPEQRS